jgi:hypothetical protein
LLRGKVWHGDLETPFLEKEVGFFSDFFLKAGLPLVAATTPFQSEINKTKK